MTHALELRERPGWIPLRMFRVPLPLYRMGLGWIFGHAFLLLIHRGRKTGTLHATALKTLSHDARTGEVIVFSAWGDRVDWIRNLRAHPAVGVRIGRRSFRPIQRFLSEDEAFNVVATYRERHPRRVSMLAWLLEWGDLRSDPAMREFVRTRPFVSLTPSR